MQVSFGRWTRDGVLRHPVYLGSRDDKRPPDVRLPARRPPAAHATERAAGPAATPPPRRATARTPHPEPAVDDILAQLEDLERNRRRGTLVLSDGARVPVGNLHKVFWPEPGVTKGELLRFYLRAAPYLLPVVADRPLVMKRFPNGVEGKSFYQHRAPDPLPDGLRVTTVRESPDSRPRWCRTWSAAGSRPCSTWRSSR